MRILVSFSGGKDSQAALIHTVEKYGCDCGIVFETSGQSLRQGIQSCGCLHRENVSARLTKDEAGNRYGRLTVLRRFSRPGVGGFVKWLCLCDCGRERVVRGSDLRSGLIRDCGMRCPLRKEEERGIEFE